MDKRRAVTAFQKRFVNPFVRLLAGSRLLPSVALLETTGRRSGQPRRTPVGEGLEGETFWIVTEHGRRAGYVRNIQANARVRVKVHGRWRTGTAHVVPDDDPLERQRQLGRTRGASPGRRRRRNARMVRLMGTEHLTVRIDLDPL